MSRAYRTLRKCLITISYILRRSFSVWCDAKPRLVIHQKQILVGAILFIRVGAEADMTRVVRPYVTVSALPDTKVDIDQRLNAALGTRRLRHIQTELFAGAAHDPRINGLVRTTERNPGASPLPMYCHFAVTFVSPGMLTSVDPASVLDQPRSECRDFHCFLLSLTLVISWNRSAGSTGFVNRPASAAGTTQLE